MFFIKMPGNPLLNLELIDMQSERAISFLPVSFLSCSFWFNKVPLHLWKHKQLSWHSAQCSEKSWFTAFQLLTCLASVLVPTANDLSENEVGA